MVAGSSWILQRPRAVQEEHLTFHHSPLARTDQFLP